MVQALQKILGDYQGFFSTQRDRLRALSIDISGYPISHIAFRTETLDEYLDVRDALEAHCLANSENVWNGRPISKLLLNEPLDLSAGFATELIELIPPAHRDRYKMGLEHVGVVIGESLDRFCKQHRAALSGQQHQSAMCEPYFVRFDDDTMVKLYRHSLLDVCVHEGQRFDGFYHVDD